MGTAIAIILGMNVIIGAGNMTVAIVHRDKGAIAGWLFGALGWGTALFIQLQLMEII